MIDPNKYGVSFSIKQCKALQVDPAKNLEWLISQMGFRRFRLMSYWDEIEQEQGLFDFNHLDNQFRTIRDVGGYITLCVGVRQPRWPESHWPSWTHNLPNAAKYQALEQFIKYVIERYKGQKYLLNYQLENEALNRSFGNRGDFNRNRIQKEYSLIKQLDPSRSIIMSTSNSWGIPVFQPKPDIVGFSVYTIRFDKDRYTHSIWPAWFYQMRAKAIKKPCFIHELQAEPWGHKPTQDMSIPDQNRAMPIQRLEKNIKLAKEIGLYPIDLWGGEWWYRRWEKFNDSSPMTTIIENIT